MIEIDNVWNEETKTFTKIERELSQEEINFIQEENNIKHLESNKYLFKVYREELFKKWDILKTNVAVGLEDPLTTEEIQWYNDMKDFPTLITVDTVQTDYPVTPERLM